MTRGRHIAIEGIDGSGLTTHSKLLVANLRARGINAEYYKEPTNGPIGAIIREYLAKSREIHEFLALLFAADRYWNYHLRSTPISHLLEQGWIVVSDRYKYSSIAYQGAFAGIDWVWQVNSRVPHSDAIIYIDVPVEVALARIKARLADGKSPELYERREKLERIREAFNIVLDLAERDGVRVYRVPGTIGGLERSIDDVSREILEIVLSII